MKKLVDPKEYSSTKQAAYLNWEGLFFITNFNLSTDPLFSQMAIESNWRDGLIIINIHKY